MAHLPALWGVVFDRAWVFALLVPLIALVLIAHFLKARRVSIPVPSLIPWSRLKDRAAPGARRKRRFSSRLFLQILFLGAALLAASGPWWAGEAPAPGTILVLFDRSASMNSPSPEGGSRLEAARKALAGLLAGAPGDTRIRLRCFPPRPGGDLEFPAADAGERLKSLTPTDAPGSLSAMLRNRGGEDRAFYCVLAVSDGTGPAPPLPEGGRLLLVGGPCANVGVEKFAVEALDGGRFRVFLRVRNASSRARSVPLEMRAGDLSFPDLPVLELGPGTVRGITLFPKGVELPEDEVLEVSIRPGDDFESDDRVFAVSTKAKRKSVTLGGTDAPYLARFLTSDPDLELHPFLEGESTHSSGDRLFLFHERTPPRPPRGAPSVVVNPRSDFWGVPVLHEEGDLSLTFGPLLEKACRGLGAAPFRRVAVLDPEPPGAEVHARANGKALILRHRPPGKPPFWFVGLPVDGEASDWVLRPWFPIFWKRLLDLAYPTGGGASTRRREYDHAATGTWISLRGPDGSGGKLIGPRGRVEAVRTTGGRIAFFAERAGVYGLLDASGAPRRRVAVNLLAPEEVNLFGRQATPSGLPEAPPGGNRAGGIPLRGVAACVGLVLLSILLLLEYPRPAAPPASVLIALVLIFPSCGRSSSGPAGNGASTLRPGRPLPRAPAEEEPVASLCSECGKLAGPGHRCGLSFFCLTCGVEASLTDHVCGLSRFCPGCGKEAALAGHRCGETYFCRECKMEVPSSHRHGEAEKTPWGKIR